MRVTVDHSMSVSLDTHEFFKFHLLDGSTILVDSLTAWTRGMDEVASVSVSGYRFKQDGELGLTRRNESGIPVGALGIPQNIRELMSGSWVPEMGH